MASYLLLRSNKQSGPYTFEELSALGLKPYDLIWTEGRSAAWRYPSEIDELKDIAPVVEEQPYDRFYKKTTEKHYHETVAETKKEPLLVSKPAEIRPIEQKEEIKPTVSEPVIPLFEEKKVVKETPVIVMQTRPIEPILKPIPEDPVEEPKYVQPLDTKKLKVFVSLPNNTVYKTAETKVTPQSASAESPTSSSVPAMVDNTANKTVGKSHPIAAKAVGEDEVELKEEYSVPLDEIKKMYMENYLSQKNKKKIKREKILNYSKYAAAALFIIILGSFVYSAIRMDKKVIPLYADEKAQVKEVEKTRPVRNNDFNKQTPNQQDIENTESDPGEEIVVKDPPKTKKQQLPVTDTNETATVHTDEHPVEETLQTEDKRTSRINTKPVDITSQVSVKANDYKRKAFGGIHNLQLTVHNDSKYVIDKVMVELQFLKPSEQPLKSEIYYFNSIAPNGSMTIKIPDNPRGIKVNYKITHIVSNQYEQDIAGL